jgi:hypothetical protein
VVDRTTGWLELELVVGPAACLVVRLEARG